MRQLKILMSIVVNKFHHVATQDPGHGTKFVTLPSFYIAILASTNGQVSICLDMYIDKLLFTSG